MAERLLTGRSSLLELSNALVSFIVLPDTEGEFNRIPRSCCIHGLSLPVGMLVFLTLIEAKPRGNAVVFDVGTVGGVCPGQCLFLGTFRYSPC